MEKIGNDWDEVLREEWNKPYFKKLSEFLETEYNNETIYPAADDIFNAFKLTPYEDVKVVILGQDPYHEPGQAQGLAFSVPEGQPLPPSLVNIFKELADDVSTEPKDEAESRKASEAGEDELIAKDSGGTANVDAVLLPWARQGVLLLNTALTVRAHRAGSHRGAGWEQFTDAVIELLAARTKPMVFVLWGAGAISKKELIIEAQSSAGGRHLIITAPHPSPLSAYRGFFGGRYFSRCNYFITDNGMEPIDWMWGLERYMP